MTQTRYSRREAFQLAGVGALGAMALPPLAGCSALSRIGLPRNIIFMVSDGMSAGVPGLAQALSRQLRQKNTHWHGLLQNQAVALGQFDMASLSSMVTDSAAAITSWCSGSRVDNISINMLPDGTELLPIGRIARQTGRKVGMVTTTRITHATPAGFLARVRHRDQEEIIARQYLGEGDVLLGGGRYYFTPEGRDDSDDLEARYREKGYRVLNKRSELSGISGSGPVLGTFGFDHLPYTIDCNRESRLREQTPSLPEMARAALRLLSDKPFLLQIEGGRVDHAAHSNDAGAIVWEQLMFDDAIGEVLEFCRDRNDTLVIITTDHGNSNPGLNGMGNEYGESNACFARLADCKESFASMREGLASAIRRKLPMNARAVADRIANGTGIQLRDEEGQALLDVLQGKPVIAFNSQHAGFEGLLGDMLSNHLGIGWTGTTHTADWVTVMALGPGSELFRGLLRNTDAFPRLVHLLGAEHVNPKDPHDII
ncbi:MAG: alkaline phosphatase [Methylacidiphilales bacterium]|nr:alkaline phosphatase [Candidatus Methylacidiphilales bacterium]